MPKLVRRPKDLAAEIADVLEVIDKILRVFRISPGTIQKARTAAMQQKGGFQKRWFLVWSQDNGYRTNERRYAK